ncbi:YgdI/YgdR family lipoprotein [Rouxiella chamberiensis]|uniref:YgdI/YgdR family lipoprotein n=1 Tax=Rouxiella chamberiensis TaxID=1513468 RepID=A0ABY7HQ66_9GAMM|nr:YgdI/YgdR family lipoprotein [Rouxiella chamberiensis]WAT01224.1 YgdI/YgdR family lipoprotein [Rouxiella chamberiensis]
MKNAIRLVGAVGIAFTLMGCSSDYVIATKDGNIILTEGKPELDSNTGLLSYEDAQGNERQINNDQVSQIMKR